MQPIFEKYKDYLLYSDQNIYVFENDALIITLNDNDVIIQLNNLKFKIPECYHNREQIFQNFILGNYCIKEYFRNNKSLYAKLIWKKRELRNYNKKTKYGFLQCKKINKIEIIQGAAW